MNYERPIYVQVEDVDGALWNVHDARATKHGFDLLFGFPVSRIESSGLPRLIATKALRDYWEANRIKHNGTLFDLPAGRTTLKRARQRLGFNVPQDAARFWQLRLHDLRKLGTREFSVRHDVPQYTVKEMRLKLLGKWARESNWWREPEFLKVLRSDITLRETAKALGIGISHAKRLRDRLRLEDSARRGCVAESTAYEPCHCV